MRIAAIFLWLIPCLFGHGLWRLVRQKSPWPRLFLGGAGWCTGTRVRISGDRHDGPVLFIANHLSWIDILVVAGATNSAFVAKADMADWPVLGWLASLNKSVYVSREARLSVAEQMQMVRDALVSDQPLTLFPEGTTGDGITLLPFRSSLLAAVTPPPPNVRVQPLVIDYGEHAPRIAWTAQESVGHNALRVLAQRGTIDVTLHFLPLLDAHDTSDRKIMTAEAQAAIAARLEGA
jgi:lyso-ornithine lipid O-acyltransferase